MRHVLKYLSIGFALANGAANYPPADAVRLVEIAVKHNPALASAYLSVEAAHSSAESSKAWEAPEVAVDFFQTPLKSFPNPLKDQREIDYSVSQTIPFPGKLKAMAQPHHLHGAAEAYRADAFALDLRRQILSAYAGLYAAEWRGRLIREDRLEVARLRGAARAGYEGGMGAQSDLLQAESEDVRLQGEAFRAAEEKAGAWASLSSLLGEADSMPQVDNLFPPSAALPLDSLETLAASRRPDLEAMQMEVQMAQADVKAGWQDGYPDFMLGGTYKNMTDNMTGGSQGFWSVSLGMKVPIAPWSFSGVRAQVDQARIQQHKREQDYASAKLGVVADVQRAAASLVSASGRIELLRDRRLPLTGQALRSSLTAYQGGKTDFNNVLTAFREVRAAQQEYHEAVADHLKAWAALEWATGGTLDPILESEGE